MNDQGLPESPRRNFKHIEVRRIAGALGAEITGVDLSEDLGIDTIAEIRLAWLDNQVVFFRAQDLTPARQLAFAKRFGRVIAYPLVKGLEECPEVVPVVKLPHERINFGGLWHADTTYLPTPPSGAMLLARELPPHGGDTLFANQQLAYDALSAEMRNFLDGLTVIQSSAKADVTRTREDRVREAGTESDALVAEHPAVMVHPETGRKSLYMNYGHTVAFRELTEDENRALLEFLFRHQIKPEFTCRFQWRPGSMAFWDNRSCQHNPVNDYHGFKRVMHRVTIGDPEPG